MRHAVETGIDVQVGHTHDAGVIAAASGMQPGFVPDEGDGVRCRRGNSVRPYDVAGVGIQAARHIEREHGAVESVEEFYDAMQGRSDSAGEADAEKSIDDECPSGGSQHTYEISRICEAYSRLHGIGMGASGIRGLLRGIGKHQHRNLEAGLFKVGGGFQRIPSVVAWAGEHENRRIVELVAGDIASELAGGAASPLHQREARQGSQCRMFDVANFSYRIEHGRGGHGMEGRDGYSKDFMPSSLAAPEAWHGLSRTD
jgi:hypothetical protein